MEMKDQEGWIEALETEKSILSHSLEMTHEEIRSRKIPVRHHLIGTF